MTSKSENWLPVVGYEGLYEVSDQGRIKRVAGGQGAVPGIRRPSIHPAGYQQISLSANNVQATKKISRLVLEAFVGPCPPGMEACHWNDIADDDRLENLRWDTHAANIVDRTRNNHPRKQPKLRTHCKAGHEYVEGSFRMQGNTRICLACLRERDRRRSERKRKYYSREDLKVACKNGHPRTDDNQYVSPKGKRECNDCRKIAEARRDPEHLRKMARERYWKKRSTTKHGKVV